MRRYVFLTSLVVLIVVSAFGQNYYELKQAADFFRMHEMKIGQINTLTGKDIEGTPYLNDEFVTGNVFSTSKIKYEGMELRYNIFNDEMEFKGENNQILAIAAPETIDKIEYGEVHMVYAPFTVGKNTRKRYFIVVEEGKASLYKKTEVAFQEAKKAAAYADPEPAKFIRKPDEYYIRIGVEPANVIAGRKDLPKLFPEHKTEITSFLKENKIRPNREDELKKLVAFYNSL